MHPRADDAPLFEIDIAKLIRVMDAELRGYEAHYGAIYLSGRYNDPQDTPITDLLSQFVADLVGAYTDRRPQPYSLVAGMGMTLLGLIVLANASSYGMLILAAGLQGRRHRCAEYVPSRRRAVEVWSAGSDHRVEHLGGLLRHG